jgi:hypothetical protein
MTQVAGPTAALAGIPAGLQAQGVWMGRRQLFVRFAAEAETATMYTADALANELKRSASRSVFHSISISGRDPLSNIDYLRAVFDKKPTALPAMLDCDGQRPTELGKIASLLELVQVTLEGAALDAMTERAIETLAIALDKKLRAALVLAPSEQTSDAQLLRIVEHAGQASADASIIIHPPAGIPLDRNRRWITLMERGTALHRDIRIALRLPPPTGMR